MTEVNANVQALQTYFNQVKTEKIGSEQFQDLKVIALSDQQLDQDEAKFLMDKLGSGAFDSGTTGEVTQFLSGGYQKQDISPIAYIGRNRLSNVKEVSKEFEDLKKAQNITDENGIDEVYFKDKEGKIYIAYGSEEKGGALDLRGLKPGYVGRLGEKQITVLHINNETNTAWEGAKAPWTATFATLSAAGEGGIAKGIGEVATTVTALFIGKTVLEKGIQTAGQKAAQQAAVSVTETVAETAATKSVGVIGKAKAFGSGVGGTVKSTLRQVAVAGAVAGAVIGSVVAIGSVIGAIKGVRAYQDYATLDMVTGKY